MPFRLKVNFLQDRYNSVLASNFKIYLAFFLEDCKIMTCCVLKLSLEIRFIKNDMFNTFCHNIIFFCMFAMHKHY